MACCYIAASMIAFIIRSCDVLDIRLDIQYNEAITHNYDDDDKPYAFEGTTPQKTTAEPVDSVAKETAVLIITVSGMTCAACVGAVETAIGKVPGVTDVQVSLVLQEARVILDRGLEEKNCQEAHVNETQRSIIAAIENAGYKAVHIGGQTPAKKMALLEQSAELANLRTTLRGLSQYGTLIFALGTRDALWASHTVSLSTGVLGRLRGVLLFSLTVTAAWRYAHWIFDAAWKCGRSGRATMHTLISASTAVGLALGAAHIFFGGIGGQKSQYHYDSIVGVLLIVSLGRYMDLLSRRRASRSFAGLYALLEQTSTVQLAKLNKRIPSHLARSGDEIIIQPYSIVPCDSYIVSGDSYANEAIVTGEARPRPKTVGDRLLAGSRNGSGTLRAVVHMEATQVGTECSFLSQLVSHVEGALATKPKMQRRIDTITQHFVSGILMVAAIAAAVSAYKAIQQGHAWPVAAQAACGKLMTVLAAACPCALGIAVPCAVMAGIDVAWQNGILILEGAETMERAAGITHVVLDKTGTLTRGTPTVTHVDVHPDWQAAVKQPELALLICAAEVDATGSHPLASAVFRYMLPLCGEKAWADFRSAGGRADSTKTVLGSGVQCVVQRQPGSPDRDHTSYRVVIGSLAYLQTQGTLISDDKAAPQHGDDGLGYEGSRVFVAVNGLWAATLVLQDSPKTDARETLSELCSRGLHVSMLTGDSPGEAERIARKLDIHVAGAAAMPSQKLDYIQSLRNQTSQPGRRHAVMMVGDGINDAPSLAAADIGVMLAHGSRCLSAGGSVLILHAHQLGRLITFLDISRATLRCVHTNMAWAIAYNVLAVGLAVGLGEPLGIRITPPVAAAMMSVSSMSVTLSGLLLRNRLTKRYKVS